MAENEFYIKESKTSWLRIISLILALLLVVLLTVGAYFYTKVNQAASSDSVPVNFTVEKGVAANTIGRRLADENIIGSYWAFLLYSKLNGVGNKIQAGNYALNRNMSISEIIDVLTVGKVVPNDRRVTIVEGMTNKQLAASLESRGIFTATEFNQALTSGNYNFIFNNVAAKWKYEGFLFPDTYVIAKDATAEDLIQKMLANFESKITPDMQTEMNSDGLPLDRAIILASIIEKEVGRNKTTITSQDIELMKSERRLVASVFINRLRKDMPLESDATVNYVTGKSDRSVTIADTKIDSRYNTYRYVGLPPGPISNPGIDSIMAAIFPSTSDYYFFLNSPDGVAYFGKTLAEHNANREKYLR